MRIANRRRCLWIWPALLLLLGCENRTVERERLRTSRPPDLPPATTPLETALANQALKHAMGMVVHESAYVGNLTEGGQQDYLVVLRGGHCYKALGVGDENVRDLDLALVGPDGVLLQQDMAADRVPVLGLHVPLCLTEPGAHRLRVHMREGAGEFLVRFFKTEQ